MLEEEVPDISHSNHPDNWDPLGEEVGRKKEEESSGRPLLLEFF